ncbi:OmpA family protein [Flavihumibacter sp. UBA7668]|uniref:OmpA family protein n=1 Tax=Flavihumibacter sp. UBA7668 TaxID=1946542 RepID=UPI0025B96251|nr:OmpA family protein [Flavihumibacter sp. UBA7668]
MYKIILLLALAAGPLTGFDQAEKFLKNVKSKTTAKVNNRIDRKVDKAIDKTLDEIEGQGKEMVETQDAVKDTSKEKSPVAATGVRSYSKYDFVAGEKVVYYTDFSSDPIGELPVGWNTNGTGEVVTLDGMKGKWVQLYQNATYLTDNKDTLSENFTVEFDLVLRRTNPKAAFPVMAFGILASGTYSTTANELLKGYAANFATELNIQPFGNNDSQIHLYTYENNKRYLSTDLKKYGALQNYFNAIIHVAMQVQKERLRIWFNETKLYDLPKAIVPGTSINQLYFLVRRYGGDEAEVGYTIGNIWLAKGLPDTRNKLLKEGKFSTTGILFERGSAVIQPQSSGILKEIAGLLQSEADLKVKIIGHTDSDDSEVVNLDLSKRRAEAVKHALRTEFGIDASRIDTDGRGEAEPVGDNKTKEGRAQNRRVEFIKQ